MKLYEKMNAFLADQIVMYTKLHNLHWYVQGRSFFTLHAKFEELYDQTAEVLDEVAERLLALGQMPVASLKKALELSGIAELDDAAISSSQSIELLQADIESTAKNAQEIVSLAEAEGDGVTADQFNDYIGEYQKLLWMLKAYSVK